MESQSVLRHHLAWFEFFQRDPVPNMFGWMVIGIRSGTTTDGTKLTGHDRRTEEPDGSHPTTTGRSSTAAIGMVSAAAANTIIIGTTIAIAITETMIVTKARLLEFFP